MIIEFYRDNKIIGEFENIQNLTSPLEMMRGYKGLALSAATPLLFNFNSAMIRKLTMRNVSFDVTAIGIRNAKVEQIIKMKSGFKQDYVLDKCFLMLEMPTILDFGIQKGDSILIKE